jgi:hypothetical protein
MKDPMLGSITGIGVNWSNRAGTIFADSAVDQGCIDPPVGRSCTGDVWRQVDRSVEIDESKAARALLWADHRRRFGPNVDPLYRPAGTIG